MQKSAHLVGMTSNMIMRMTLSSKMQQLGVTLNISLMSVVPYCCYIILLYVIHLMLSLRAAMKRYESFT